MPQRRKRAGGGRTASGLIKKGYRLTAAGRVVKTGPAKKKRAPAKKKAPARKRK